MHINIKVKGIRKAQNRWRKYGKLFSGQDDRLYRQAGEIISKNVSKNVDAGGRDPKWQKRKYPYEWPILYKTGRMRARAERTALTWIHQGRRHIDQIFAPLYGFFHQYGTKKLPIRKFSKLIDPERKKIRDIFRKAFLKG